MIRGTVIGDDKINVKLKAMPDKINAILEARMQRITKRIEAVVKSDKLTGQALHVKTGTLRRSIHSEVSNDGSTITGIVGTNLVYAAYHEYGFSGTVHVKGYLRQIKSDAHKMILPDRNGKMKKTTVYATGEVKAHTRTVNYPGHSFLRSALKEQIDDIKEQIRQAVAEGAKL